MLSARNFTLVLFASLATNLFLLGIWIGDWTRAHGAPTPIAAEPVPAARPATPAAEAPLRGPVQRLLAHVPPELREGVEKRLAARRGEIQRANQQLRAARERLATIAVADPLDRGQLDQGYAELRERTMAVQKAIHLAISEAIGELPVATRRAIIADLNGGARR